jgi:hypothetical protein
MKKETKEIKKIKKHDLVREHLIKKKSLTSWDAITLYKATRLSAIIFSLRRNGWNIATNSIVSNDQNGNSCTYAKYVLISHPKKS